MLNVFCFHGRVRSEPVLLNSKKTGNTFIKFTASIDGDIPHFQRKILEEKGNSKPGNWGEVYIDFFAFKDTRGKFPGDYILKNLHKYDLISGTGRIASGKKPVKDDPHPFLDDLIKFIYLCYPPDGLEKKDMVDKVKSIVCSDKPAYRSNWVYGDYLYVQLKDVYLIKPWSQKPKSQYKEYREPNFGDRPKVDKQSYGIVAADQRVNDEDLIFKID